jgi:hypothetical protein
MNHVFNYRGDPSERVNAEASARTFYYKRGVRGVSDMACGSGFSVCILTETGEPSSHLIYLTHSGSIGEVCCWGTWQHGRLGRPIPVIENSSGRRKLFRRASSEGGPKTYARYQLRPLLVPGIKRARNVSCGEAHTLCLLENGQVLSWGQNSW